MKSLKLFLFINLCTCFISCNQNEQKAKKIIKNYLKENIDDWESYEPAFWGKLDSIITTKYEIEHLDYLSKQNKIIMDECDEIAALEFEYREDPKKLELFKQKASEKYNQKIKQLNSMMENDKKNNIWVGWSLVHNYRSKNELGNKFISKKLFRCNKELDSIITIENLN